jgi:uncharacterized RDD family membrane protein YckC
MTGSPGYGASAKSTATPDGVPFAGLGSRLGAKIVDKILIGILTILGSLPFLIAFVHGLSDYIRELQDLGPYAEPENPLDIYTETNAIPFLVSAVVLAIVVSGAYNVMLVHLKGATFGKMMFGVRVRPWADEARPTWGQAFKRWASGELLGQLVSMYSWIDYLWPLWDDRKQALHDKWPATVVVTARS